MRIFLLLFVVLRLGASKRSRDDFSPHKNDGRSEKYDRSLWKYIRQATAGDKANKGTTEDTDINAIYESNNSGLFYRGIIRQYFALDAMMSSENNNIICSPMSALMPLGKLALGAEGRSYQELLDAIGISDRHELKSSFKTTINTLRTLPGVTMRLASRIYVSNLMELNQRFINESKDIFDSAVERISMINPYQVTDKINGWVSRQTNGTINSVISPENIAGEMSMILVNAIYFRGRWVKPFRKMILGDFHTPSGVKRVTMLTHKDSYKYMKMDNLKAQVVELPYQGGKSSFIVVLPYERQGLRELLKTFHESPHLLDAVVMSIKDQSEQRIILSIPKFKFESVLDLKHSYDLVEVKSIFSKESTELNGIVKNSKLTVSSAIQKAVIEFHELGTEAAVATVFEVIPVALYLNQIIFQANHPFLFVVQADNEHLFVGACYNPSGS